MLQRNKGAPRLKLDTENDLKGKNQGKLERGQKKRLYNDLIPTNKQKPDEKDAEEIPQVMSRKEYRGKQKANFKGDYDQIPFKSKPKEKTQDFERKGFKIYQKNDYREDNSNKNFEGGNAAPRQNRGGYDYQKPKQKGDRRYNQREDFRESEKFDNGDKGFKRDFGKMNDHAGMDRNTRNRDNNYSRGNNGNNYNDREHRGERRSDRGYQDDSRFDSRNEDSGNWGGFDKGRYSRRGRGRGRGGRGGGRGRGGRRGRGGYQDRRVMFIFLMF